MARHLRRTVITGAGNLSPLGNDWSTISTALQHARSGVCVIPEWQEIQGLSCAMAAPVKFTAPEHYSRKELRSMGRVAQLAVYASELALQDAGLKDSSILSNGRCGVAYGSVTGSPDALLEFVSILTEKNATSMKATSYLRSMSHTAAVNIGVFFGLTGRVVTTNSACTSASQAIGAGYELIQAGKQDVMLVGGADEMTAAHSAVFDTLLATSNRKEQPISTPRPFDRDRDGLVIGEGASTFVLEALEHAEARGAEILAEVVGYATNSDGHHITQPNTETQMQCLQMALEDAELDADAIGYVNAHGTATDSGDISESHATYNVLGNVAISSLKGHMGHTMGACGAIEAWISLKMMQENWFTETLNLEYPDPSCACLDYIIGQGREITTNYIMSNNFAFGGINTSLIFKRFI